MPELIIWGQRELSRLRGDMDRLFNALFDDFGLPRPNCATDFDISEEDDTVVLSCSLPGFAPENVSVNVTEQAVAVRATRREDTPQGSQTASLSREMTLPWRVDPDATQAVLADGILTIRAKRLGPRRRLSPTKG